MLYLTGKDEFSDKKILRLIDLNKKKYFMVESSYENKKQIIFSKK